MLTMRSALERAERLFGENTAIIDAEARFTWAEHLDRVKRLAGVLQENGIGKGDRFGIICRNTWRHCELIHAGYWNGSVPVPVNYRLAPPGNPLYSRRCPNFAALYRGCVPDLLKTGELAGWSTDAVCIPGGGPTTELRSSDDLISTATPVEGNESGEEEDAILLYTGGTTGAVQGVRLTHRNVFSNGQQCTAPMKINAGDVYLHVAPMFHSADLLGSIYTGWCVACLSAGFYPRKSSQGLSRLWRYLRHDGTDHGYSDSAGGRFWLLRSVVFGSAILRVFADGGRVDPTYDGGVPDCQYPTGVRTYRNLPDPDDTG